MTKLELMTLLLSLKALLDKGLVEEAKDVISKVLKEAEES